MEVAIHWAVDVGDYELQICRNAVEWTSVMHASGLAGQMVRNSFPSTADAQWMRVVPGTWGGMISLDLWDLKDDCFIDQMMDALYISICIEYVDHEMMFFMVRNGRFDF